LVIAIDFANTDYDMLSKTPQMPQTHEIVTFWQGSQLGRVRRLCLLSQVKLGYRVTVFTYGHINDVPDGVVVADAEPILPLTFANRIRPQHPAGIDWRTVIQLSDFFRIRLQRLGRGLWLDSDIYLLRPIEIDPERPYFAWESLLRVGNSALYLPAMHPIVTAYENLMTQDVLFVNGLLPYHQLIGYWRRIVHRESFVPADIRTGLYGPATLTALAWRHGALRFAGKRKSFYLVHARPERFFEPSDFESIISDPGVKGFHISLKHRGDEAPLPGSLYEWAARNVQEGAAPARQRHDAARIGHVLPQAVVVPSRPDY
jgi:hypothetical protein